jgi:DNA-binding MarR family transcriptional regulator
MRDEQRDLVDTLVDQWAVEMPKYNGAAKGLVYRLIYVNERYMAAMQTRLRKQGLTLGSYGVLACLRRQGEPYAMSPTAIFQALSLSSGGVSNLLEKMEKDRLVKRSPDPNDRRGVLVKLTTRGQVIADEAAAIENEAEQDFISDISDAELGAMNAILRRVLIQLDGAAMPDDDENGS